MENGTYIRLTLTRGILLILLILSPMAGVLADIRCGEECSHHSQMKMAVTKCCHSDNAGKSLLMAQGCEDGLALSAGEYRQPIKTKSAKNVLFSEKSTFPVEETSPKFQFEDDFYTKISNSITPAIYLLDSAFLI